LDAHKVIAKLTISTSENQQVVATGKTIKRWTMNDRNYTKFEVATPSVFEIQITSASFVKNSEILERVATTIWHKDSHHFNIEIYKDAVAYGLQFVNTHVGTYPYKELNIAEIPYYGDAFYSSPNLILISEKEGWRADTSLKKEESYIYFSVITQLVRQKLMSQNEIANVQGANMLSIALPQVIALQAVQEKFGDKIVDSYLETKRNNYQKGRSNEANIESPLLYADGSDYLEPNKGVVALYEISKILSPKIFNQSVSYYMTTENGQLKTFKGLYKLLLSKSPTAKTNSIKNKIEHL